jgi:hypothetical protein
MGKTADLKVSHRCIYDPSKRSASNYDLAFPRTLTAISLFWWIVHCLGAGGIRLVDLNWFILIAALHFGMVSRTVRKASVAREEFREMLLPQLEDRYVRRLSGALHVGIAPGRKLNSYAGDYAWDIGFLVVENGLLYYGDQTRFQLLREDILRVEISRSLQFGGAPRLLIEYRTAWNHPAWLALDARGGGSKTQQLAALHHLRSQIAFLPPGERLNGFSLPMTKVPIG